MGEHGCPITRRGLMRAEEIAYGKRSMEICLPPYGACVIEFADARSTEPP